jgi:hypothetical protein
MPCPHFYNIPISRVWDDAEDYNYKSERKNNNKNNTEMEAIRSIGRNDD